MLEPEEVTPATHVALVLNRLAHPMPEAADLLGVGRTTMYRLVDAGEIATIHIGRRRVVPHEELVEYLARKRCSQVG